jgi:hypothetical protein
MNIAALLCNFIFASVDPHMVLQPPDIERVKTIQDKIIMCNHTEILSIKCHKDSHYKQYHPISTIFKLGRFMIFMYTFYYSHFLTTTLCS